MASIKTIFVVGGTGAQGLPVAEALTADGRYHLKILTRDPTSARARQLAALPNVTLMTGTVTSDATLRAGFADADGAFVNIDGFTIGEKAELYWGMRSYELARASRTVKFFVWGNLDYLSKLGGYDPRFRCGHYDGKGRVGEWILQQTRGADEMGAACFTTGPYLDMAISQRTPMAPKVVGGVVTWAVPLGSGAVPHIALADCGHYVRWLFDHPSRANGLDLAVATAHVAYADLAAAFTRVTGKPAQYIDVPLDAYIAGMGPRGARGVGTVDPDRADPATMSWAENFAGFWEAWRASSAANDAGSLLRRDYKLLDEIHPGRIRSVEEWFRRQEEMGGEGSLWRSVQPENLGTILKLHEDVAHPTLFTEKVGKEEGPSDEGL